eukprot:SAG31_NODE_16_length_36206_cov_27.355728_27_plen_58_part_00
MTMTGPEAVQAVGEQGDDEEDEDETNDYPKEAQDAILQWSLVSCKLGLIKDPHDAHI